jgi:uncharacterized protein
VEDEGGDVTGSLRRDDLPALLDRIHGVLGTHRREIDELNVFPVPDGDTGSNMTATVRSAIDAVHGLEDPTPESAGEAAVRGAMRGARGNSGVILSQVVRALVDGLDDDPLDADGLARLLADARQLAYEAVAEPVEGTMLTAIRVAADAADRLRDQPLTQVTRRLCLDVNAAVARTTSQLDVLREAGVVDAGARGFELVLDAVHGFLTGESFDEDLPAPHVHREPGDRRREAGSSAYGFEVQYLLDADESVCSDLRAGLLEIGDSVVVVGRAGLVSVHVHTDDVGPAIELGLELGRPSRIEVVDLAGPSSDGPPSRRIEPEDAAPAEAIARLGCVAVLDGSGLRSLAEELGACVVDGAAGRLPTVADLLDGAGRVRAERIVLLPGHPNAVPTALQAREVSRAEGGRELLVVEAARTPPSVLAALAVWDHAAEPDDVAADMAHAAGAVRAGEVVAAVRDADTPIGRVRRGQLLAVVDGAVVGVDDDPVEALAAVLERCRRGGCEMLTLIVGADTTPEERARAEELVGRLLPGTQVEVVEGGNRPARFTVGIE